MTQLLATNFANAFECAYPDIQLAKAVCDEYQEHVATSTSGEDMVLIIFKDDSVLLINTTEGLCYEFTEPDHALKFLAQTPELANKLVIDNRPKTR